MSRRDVYAIGDLGLMASLPVRRAPAIPTVLPIRPAATTPIVSSLPVRAAAPAPVDPTLVLAPILAQGQHVATPPPDAAPVPRMKTGGMFGGGDAGGAPIVADPVLRLPVGDVAGGSSKLLVGAAVAAVGVAAFFLFRRKGRR